MIEKLNAEERRQLAAALVGAFGNFDLRHRALRIIDQQAARIAELEAENSRLEDTRRKYITMVDELEAQVGHMADVENMRVSANLELAQLRQRVAKALDAIDSGFPVDLRISRALEALRGKA